uniref:Uncharacterized protein n=1 Tax=Anopheles quadriannulatus TaxID=34691 RepID=A0A182XR78_ANOQN
MHKAENRFPECPDSRRISAARQPAVGPDDEQEMNR